MKAQQFNVVRDELKKALKSRKVKYARLAREMGLSESGVKKMLNGKDLSFNKLSQILAAAEISVPDFFQTMGEGSPLELRLTEKQEEFFLKHPNYYNFFLQLLSEELDWKTLKKLHELTQTSVDRYLLKLDQLGLIELHPGNEVHSKYAGCVRLTFGMKLVKAVVDAKHRAFLEFGHIPNESFRGRKHLAHGTLKVKRSTAEEFNRATRDLVSEYMVRARREGVIEPNGTLEELGFLFVVTPTDGMNPGPVPNL